MGFHTGMPPAATLVDVRTGRHEGFDRAVFELTGAPPYYNVEYIDTPLGCASGEPVEIAGAAFLQVRLEPAAGHDEEGNTTFEPLELTPGLLSIVELESTCDFEGVVIWVLGLTAEVDFRVLTLEDPLRLVVDVAQP
jgi:hypothetical protein